jgi:hypothetical protein
MDIYNALPRELQLEVSLYSVDHRPKYKQVMKELMVYIHALKEEHSYCYNCYRDDVDDFDFNSKYTYVFHKKYTFCSSYCKWDTLYEFKKMYRQKNKKIDR